MSSNYRVVSGGTIVATTGVVVTLVGTIQWLWWWYRYRESTKIALLEENKRHTSSNMNQENCDHNPTCIYLDYNGTTPIYPQVVEAMMPYWTEHFGNPSSGHIYGDAPAAAMEIARQQILCDILGIQEESAITFSSSCIVFTACGTESDNLAVHWAVQQAKYRTPGKNTHHIVTSNVEHPAIELCLKESHPDVEITYVPVGTDGRVAAKDMIAAIQSNTVLVTLMLANNETGALQPVKEVSEYCRRKQILFHTDAAQAVGKVSVHLSKIGYPDMVTIVGHKIGAPKGIACLYVRPDCIDFNHVTGLLVGGGQEDGRRAGTSNVPYIVGMGVAATLSARNLIENRTRMEQLRHRLRIRLMDGISDTMLHGPTDPEFRLPNTLSIGFGGGIHSGRLLHAVREQVAASAGATCHSANGPVSAVLRAMDVPEVYARGTVRLSLGPYTTIEEVDRAAEILIDEVKRQQKLLPELA